MTAQTTAFAARSSRWIAALVGSALALLGVAMTPPRANAADTTATTSTRTTAIAATTADGALGAIDSFTRTGDTYLIRSGDAALRISAKDKDLLRVEVAPDGTFTDPANTKPTDPTAPDANIVVKTDYPGGATTLTERADAYVIATQAAQLTVTKSPITLHLAKADGTVLFDETKPLSWGGAGTTQTLAQGASEQYFGGGMQNGRFSHRGESIQVAVNYNWNEGGNPNSAPFYISSNGYAALRNTFAPGTYDFSAPTTTTQNEQRFDAYYFVGDAKQVIDGYTELTGRPLALPMSALEIGDADCYLHNANRGERQTLRDATAIAQGYADAKMPLGWMLVNDGYGCGYEDLKATGDMLHSLGAELGLWTQSDLTNQEPEVSDGVRVRKTDVAWVGPGYRFALDACEKARDGIQDNSSDRATVVTIEGWAGTQRCGIPWSGDQSGSWDYIRWQIPTYAGSTMSGMPVTTGDVDGIFGGSADTYTRDLQWKMLLPMTYAMSGWAASDKQPYRYGEPYTSINRDYLMLHERLLPYFYTHTMNATKNGVGATRPLYLEYPNDPKTWGDAAKYEFLAGADFLVAPVYSDTTVRDGIYLPAGQWVDYWTGRVYAGGQTINGYQAPLERLPLFVRAGAIVPMFPGGTMDWAAGKASGQLDLDIYPTGTSSFTNYEDDGRSQAHTSGASATQKFDVSAPTSGSGQVTVSIGALTGSYAGKPAARHYNLAFHSGSAPGSAYVGTTELTKVPSAAALKAADSGWFFDAGTGVTTVKTPALSTNSAATVRLAGGSAIGGQHAGDLSVDVAVNAARVIAAGQTKPMSVAFTNSTGSPVSVTATSLTAPAGWTVSAKGATTASVVKSGATFTATYDVTPPAAVTPGDNAITGSATYVAHSVSRTVSVTAKSAVSYASLAAAANNVGVTASAAPAPGDLDGGGSSFLSEQLAAKGVTPGAALQLNGFDFTWPAAQPGTKDNVAAAGQTFQLSGQGNAIAFLGTGTSTSASGTATVYYTDGSTTTGTLGMPNWCCLAVDSFGAKTAVATLGKNTPTGPAYPTTEYRLYTKTLRIDPAKQVVGVTLPNNTSVHVFAMSIGTEEIPPPALADGQYAFSTSGKALQAPGSESTQIQMGAPSSDPSQKWSVKLQADGAYEIKNAGSGQCLDVFNSSKTSGSVVGQWDCGGTDNQRWLITAENGSLVLRAKHSGLSLTAGADDLVTQASNTGAANQKWTAAAN